MRLMQPVCLLHPIRVYHAKRAQILSYSLLKPLLTEDVFLFEGLCLLKTSFPRTKVMVIFAIAIRVFVFIPAASSHTVRTCPWFPWRFNSRSPYWLLLSVNGVKIQLMWMHWWPHDGEVPEGFSYMKSCWLPKAQHSSWYIHSLSCMANFRLSSVWCQEWGFLPPQPIFPSYIFIRGLRGQLKSRSSVFQKPMALMDNKILGHINLTDSCKNLMTVPDVRCFPTKIKHAFCLERRCYGKNKSKPVCNHTSM